MSKVTPIASKRRMTPPDRGKLLTPAQVAARIGRDRQWVLRNVPNKVHIGHRTKRYYEHDIDRWLEGLREAS